MTVSVFYPDADPETTSVDGKTRQSGTNALFGTLQAGAGDQGTDSGLTCGVSIDSGSSADRFSAIFRGIMLFDTAAIPDSDMISIAIISLNSNGAPYNGFTQNPDLDIVSSAPASDTAVVAGDFDSLGTTVYSEVGFASLASSGNYTDFGMDSNGISAVSKTGVSKFGLRFSWDVDNSFGGTWVASDTVDYSVKSADTAGTTSDPKLTVTHAAASTFTPRAVVIS